MIHPSCGARLFGYSLTHVVGLYDSMLYGSKLSSSVPAWITSRLKNSVRLITQSRLTESSNLIGEAFESHLSAHVLHPGQCQLSQVAMLHSRAHQWHWDVPGGQYKSRKQRKARLLTVRVVMNTEKIEINGTGVCSSDVLQ